MVQDLGESCQHSLHDRSLEYSRPASENHWFLASDVLDLIFTRLNDGLELGKCCRVNRLWSEITNSDKFWQALVKKRWKVKELVRHSSGPLASDRNSFWKKIYSQWHRSSREPSSSFSGDRYPPFASSMSRSKTSQRFERFHGVRFSGSSKRAMVLPNPSAYNLYVWVNCVHSSDCTLSTGMLGLHVVVQNFGKVPLRLYPDKVCLQLKTGEKQFASWLGCESKQQGMYLAVGHEEDVVEDQERLDACKDVVLGQWDFAVIGTCHFHMPCEALFEPDALELCDELSVYVERADGYSSLESIDKEAVDEYEGRSRHVTAKFDENRIWRHYTEVNSKFWVFHERPTIAGGI